MPSIRRELLLLTRCVVISPNGWQAHVNGRSVPKSPVLQSIPDVLDGKSLLRLLDILETTRVCAGHPDEKFLTMSDSRKKKLDAVFVDDFCAVELNGMWFLRTVRSNDCHMLVHGTKCPACVKQRNNLRAKFNRWQKQQRTPRRSKQTEISSHTNYRYVCGHPAEEG